MQIVILNPVNDKRNQRSDDSESVMTIATLGHHPVQLGGLYTAVQSEFIPGRTGISCPVLNYHELRHESLV